MTAHARPRRLLLVVLLVMPAIMGGCSCRDAGPARHRVSGTISYEGQPVKFGWIIFSPEQGPGATANIEDGRFETPRGFGAIGGPHTLEVVAFDDVAVADPDAEGEMNPMGERMFRYVFQRDFPQRTSTFDIEVSREDIQGQR